MKKLAAYLLILSMLFSFTAFAEGAESEALVERKYVEEMNFLKTIGITDWEVLKNDTITRGEFTSLILNAFYPGDVFDVYSDNVNAFLDVDPGHPCFPEIKAAKGMQIVNGTYDNKFLPDEIISYTDAVVITIKTLGLSYHAVANGGYPTGFYATASSFGISKGISKYENKLSGDVAAKLIYNALFSNYADKTSITASGEVGITVTPDKNILQAKYDIYKYDAKIIATPLSSLEGSVTDMGTIMLKLKDESKLSVWVNSEKIQLELGKMLTVYVRRNKETGKEEIVYYKSYDRVEEVTLFGSDIINVTGNYLELESENGKYEKLTLDEFPDVIYNGVLQERYDNSSFKVADGIITLSDTDNNSKFDTVSIKSFNYSGMSDNIAKNLNPAWNIVVDRVNIDGEYIICKWNPRKNLDFDSEKVILSVSSTDEEIKTVKDIKAGDVISVAEAPKTAENKKVYFLFVERNIKNLMYDSVNPSENILTFDGVDYKVSSSLYSVRERYYNNLTSGSDVQVSLDAVGKIAYMADMQRIINTYAYVISAKVNNMEGSRVLVVKLLEGTNNIATYKVSEKAKIDGQIYDTADEQYDALTKRPDGYGKWINTDTGKPYEEGISRPVIIKLNNLNEISYLNTDTPDIPTVSERLSSGQIAKLSDERNIYTDANSIGYSNEEAYDSSKLKAGYRAPRTDLYREASSTVQGKFYITSSTYIFKVADIDTAGFNDYGIYLSNPGNNKSLSYDIIKSFELPKEDLNYKVVLSDTLINEYKYDIQGYNIDPDTGIAEMVVIRGMDVNTVSDDGDKLELAVFLEKNTYYDPELQEEKTKLYYTVDGKTKLSAIYDKERMHPSYDYIINGSKKEDNFFKADIKALEKGDIIRVSLKGEYLAHIERALVMSDLESSYSSMAKTRQPEGYYITSGRIWYDVYASAGGTTGSYTRYIIVPDKVKGSFVHAVMGGKTSSKAGSSATYTLSEIDMEDPSTYVSIAVDFGSVTPTLVTLSRRDDGKICDVSVSEGSLSDLRSLEDGYSIEDASRVIYKNGDLLPTQIIIINYEDVK